MKNKKFTLLNYSPVLNLLYTKSHLLWPPPTFAQNYPISSFFLCKFSKNPPFATPPHFEENSIFQPHPLLKRPPTIRHGRVGDYMLFYKKVVYKKVIPKLRNFFYESSPQWLLRYDRPKSAPKRTFSQKCMENRKKELAKLYRNRRKSENLAGQFLWNLAQVFILGPLKKVYPELWKFWFFSHGCAAQNVEIAENGILSLPVS